MKKIVLFSLVAALAITMGCSRDSVIEATPPAAGIWDELILVELQQVSSNGDTTLSKKQLTWQGMLDAHAAGQVNLNDLREIIREVEFLPDGDGGTMRITIRYLEGLDVENPCGVTLVMGAYGNVTFRREFIEVQYKIEAGHTEDVGKILVISGQYTGPAFGSSTPEDPNCSPTGAFAGVHFEFTYPDRHRRTMRFIEFDDAEHTLRSTHFLQLRANN